MVIADLKAKFSGASQGFTLAELLVTLAILGVVSTFTIPKVLSAQQNVRYVAVAKEVAAMLEMAFLENQFNQPFGVETFYNSDILPRMNYVRIITDGSRSVDGSPEDGTTHVCSAGMPCILLHSGAILYYWQMSFCNTVDDTAVWYRVDPDGKADGQIQAVQFFLFPNGRISSNIGIQKPTRFGFGWPTCSSVYGTGLSDVSWFKW